MLLLDSQNGLMNSCTKAILIILLLNEQNAICKCTLLAFAYFRMEYPLPKCRQEPLFQQHHSHPSLRPGSLEALFYQKTCVVIPYSRENESVDGFYPSQSIFQLGKLARILRGCSVYEFR